MNIKKIIIIGILFVTMIVLFKIFIPGNKNIENEESLSSPIQASFFEVGMTQHFTEEDWEEELNEWKEVGIKYIIISTSAYKNEDGWYTYYPSSINNAKIYYDAVGEILKWCKKANVKVFIPVGNNPCGANLCKYDKDCFNKQGKETFLKSIQETLPFIHELYNKYYDEYKEIWYGWYFPPEISNNIDWENPEYFKIGVDTLSESLNMTIEEIRKLNDNFVIMLSPYLNVEETATYCTKNESVISNYYKEVINNTKFIEGDILAPQDSAKNMKWNIDMLKKYTKAYRDAVDNANKKIQLWSNLETFVYDEKYARNADVIDYGQSTYLNTLLDQINAEKQYVDNFMSCSFCYYYTKPNSIQGFYNSFRDYLKYNTIDVLPPELPTKAEVSTMMINGKECLNIELFGMNDDYGIARMNVYKNGKMYCYRCSTRNGTYIAQNYVGISEPNSFFDDEFNLENDNAKYEIELIDCSGNKTLTKFRINVISQNGRLKIMNY